MTTQLEQECRYIDTTTKCNFYIKINKQKYHFHAHSLVNNFISRRNKLEKYSKLLTKQSLPKHTKLRDNMAIETLSHYGYYKAISLLKINGKSIASHSMDSILYIHAVGAMEYLHELLIDLHIITYPTNPCDLPPIASILARFNEEFIKCGYHGLLGTQFLHYYATINFPSKQSPKRCEYYDARYGDCGSWLAFNCTAKANLGYLMLFYGENIIKFIQSANYTNWSKSEVSALYQLKKWNEDDMKAIGKKYILDSFNKYKQMVHDKVKSVAFDANGAHSLFYIMGKLYSLSESKHHEAMHCFMFSASLSTDLYDKVLSLIEISINCYKYGKYLLGIKVLKCAYKLSDGYMLPSFVNEEYFIQRRKFRKRRFKLVCDYCGCKKRDGVEIQCCAGCMERNYCSKSCQKLDWRHNHRNECNKQWEPLYLLLKNLFFDRL